MMAASTSPLAPSMAAPVRNADVAATMLPVPKEFLGRETPVRMGVILKAAAVYFQTSEQQIKSAARAKAICDIRKIVVYVMAGLSGQSLAQIGRFLNRDHTTIIHSLECIKRAYGTEQAVTETIDRFLAYVIATNIIAAPDIDTAVLARIITQNPRYACNVSVDEVRALAAVVHTLPDLKQIVAQLETDLVQAQEAEAEALRQARQGMIDALATAIMPWMQIMDDLDKSPSPRGAAALRLRLAAASTTLHKVLKKHLKGQ